MLRAPSHEKGLFMLKGLYFQLSTDAENTGQSILEAKCSTEPRRSSRAEQLQQQGDDLLVKIIDSHQPAQNEQVGGSSFLEHFDIWPNP